MSAAQVIDIVVQREPNDCAIVALSMYLGVTYEDVLRVVTVTDRRQGKSGLWARTMIRIAKALGHTMVLRSTFDLSMDYGILRLPDHAAVLRNGLVFDGNGTVLEAEAFLAKKRVPVRKCKLLVCEE